MKVIVLGGTRFIGRATVEELVAHGHQVLVVHRGETEPPEWVPVEHLHVARAELASARAQLAAFGAEVALDSIALTRTDAVGALGALPAGIRLVVLSSVDVYRAYSALMAKRDAEPLPLDETSPLREQRYPYRGQGRADMDDYDKLDVEEEYRARGGTVLRLPMVYGPHDRQRREEFILRRVRAGRRQIPFGAGTWLRCAGSVFNMASGIRRALEHEHVAGEVFNLADRHTPTIRLWATQILRAAAFEAELVVVPEEALPADLSSTGTVAQHLLADASKARHMLGFEPTDPEPHLARSVAWHLAHPPTEPDPGFEADDRALELRTRIE